ncbi:hypothetical protein CDQ83_14295 [Clostridium thermosuccinogenes]|nr:hypothetical protein CDQ83_14295 [Pseudoclostridium thermosuccinogenes]
MKAFGKLLMQKGNLISNVQKQQNAFPKERYYCAFDKRFQFIIKHVIGNTAHNVTQISCKKGLTLSRGACYYIHAVEISSV